MAATERESEEFGGKLPVMRCLNEGHFPRQPTVPPISCLRHTALSTSRFHFWALH